MGWTSKSYDETTHTSFGKKHAEALMNEEFNTSGYSVLKISLTKAKNVHEKNVIYSAMKDPSGNVFGMVVLIDIVNGDIFWKEIDETMGPTQDNCPKEIIEMLSKTKYEYAIEWRKRCLQNGR